MNFPGRLTISVLFAAIIFVSPFLPLGFVHITSNPAPYSYGTIRTDAAYRNSPDPVPLRRITLVQSDPLSYIDDFAYMAAVPTATFWYGGTHYISPVIHVSESDSEGWLIQDWVEYLDEDGGTTQAIGIGDFSHNYIMKMQGIIGTQVYPQLKGASSSQIAARLAVAEWASTDTAVLALSQDQFQEPTVTEGSYEYTFSGAQVSVVSPSIVATTPNPVTFDFTSSPNVGWIEGKFNWTGSDLFVHTLTDPNGVVMDYSLYRQVFAERNYAPSPVPLYFWVPNTVSGEWTLEIDPESFVADPVSFDSEIKYHPGFTHTVDVPSDASWLNVTLNWDNAATDLNMAMVDPSGRLVAWAPVGSILSKPGREDIQISYPMPGQWNIVVGWMDATEEVNNADLSWSISQIPQDLTAYLESAANGAVLASQLNSPLLYVTPTEIPSATQWALDRLGVSSCILVDPLDFHSSSLETSLSSEYLFVNIANYPMLSNMIQSLSGQSDVIVSLPLGTGNEFFSASAFAGAAHGGPVFSLAGDDNTITTRAEETWAPYLIGPEIEVYVQNQYTTRTENGWYDERIPNIYSMRNSAQEFESFLTDRGAYNSTSIQTLLIVSPIDLLKASFDRSLQTHFSPGRIPALSAETASVMISRGVLHRFLFETSDSADTSLLSLYAYTHGGRQQDNYDNLHTIYQVDDLTDSLESAGFAVEYHIGSDEVFEALRSQVGFWSLSTHGTLTVFPTDPPMRPDGVGIFSLRDEDEDYGYEVSLTVQDGDDNGLVNPYVWPLENPRHVLLTTDDLQQSVGNIGSTIVHVTACLLGGSRLPRVLMEHGAAGVIAAPRTVYFRAGGLLSVIFTENIVDGNSTGLSLNRALAATSVDYTDPIIDLDPPDYANQQILYGDPETYLFNPDATPHIAAVDPLALVLDGHIPGRGVHEVAALGYSNYLPTGLAALDADFDYYESTNFSDFTNLISLHKIVIMEPSSLDSLENSMNTISSDIAEFVTNGGTIIVLGATGNLDWLPWPVSYASSETGSTITVVDDGHPLVSEPNSLGPVVDYQGHFDSHWVNFSVVATDGTNPVIIASTVGTGKIGLTTTNPSGLEKNRTLENALAWRRAPSIILSDIDLSQTVIWEGDRVRINFTLIDQVGDPITGALVSSLINQTEVGVQEGTQGTYTILLSEEWTTGRTGPFSITILAMKAGYDSLTVEISDFMFIRPSPILTVAILGGVFIAAMIGWAALKRRRQEPLLKRSSKKPRDNRKRDREREKEARRREKEAEKRRREREERFDAKEFFDV
ncbi:MAG: hypothetical protein JSW61_12640 [Candidatus Thorarchaeota archaeon]|nr:MAG: hypothetical protein JSW61_12640 [Candidatus Thorarchaeota archaeon]